MASSDTVVKEDVMRKDQAICMTCDDVTECIIEEEPYHVSINGVEFDVMLKHAYCKRCGDESFSNELSLYNCLQRFDGYRERVGLLTSKQIKDIRKKRGMSQRDLARFLRLGEKTITRYETGTIQEKSLDLLLRLVDNDETYQVIKKLNQNIK